MKPNPSRGIHWKYNKDQKLSDRNERWIRMKSTLTAANNAEKHIEYFQQGILPH